MSTDTYALSAIADRVPAVAQVRRSEAAVYVPVVLMAEYRSGNFCWRSSKACRCSVATHTSTMSME